MSRTVVYSNGEISRKQQERPGDDRIDDIEELIKTILTDMKLTFGILEEVRPKFEELMENIK